MLAFVGVDGEAVGVGAVGLLPPLAPPHPTNDPIAIAIASHVIVALLLSIWSS